MNNRIRIAKTFTFHAAHNLPHHEGECAKLHGHSFKMTIEVSGSVKRKGAQAGMVMDFKELKNIVRDQILLPWLDHRNLNDCFPNPTSENLVQVISKELSLEFLRRGVRLQRVRIWETETSYAEWRREDNE